MSADALSLARPWLAPLLRSAALGAVLGGLGVLALRVGPEAPALGSATELARGGVHLVDALNGRLGPVWVPMLLVALRVGWLAARALRTRHGHGPPASPVRPELGQLAPLFAALGLCGTVWGLSFAFDALGGGDFLSRLPVLLAGLGAAMTSTLLGLGLQIATLVIATLNPAWSRVQVQRSAGGVSFELEGNALGDDAAGLEALVLALRARQPEALRLELVRAVPDEWHARIRDVLWRRLDSALPVREVRV